MRLENLVVSVICGVAVVLAVLVSWRGRHLPLVTPRTRGPQSAKASASDALRSVAAVLAAGIMAGVLVAGLGGRLVMRVLGATSGSVQGRRTEADAVVGEITFAGTVSLLIFVGLLLPIAASFLYLATRRILPNRAWIAGLIFGLVLLAVFGVDDPLSPDNVDFQILTPIPLAVVLIVLTALLFGTTFSALAARLDRSMSDIMDKGRDGKLAYASLLVLIVPLFLAPAAIYVGVRAIAHGRISASLEELPVRLIARVLVLIAVSAAVLVVGRAVIDIL